ncbi:hypothetical protein H4S03_009574, partial [Coemansia sp. S3946]
MTIATTDNSTGAEVSSDKPQVERTGAERGVAQIKAEYQIQRRAEPTPRIEPASDAADAPASGEGAVEAAGQGAGKRSGGQHQN